MKEVKQWQRRNTKCHRFQHQAVESRTVRVTKTANGAGSVMMPANPDRRGRELKPKFTINQLDFAFLRS
jgi:hypothetical protein